MGDFFWNYLIARRVEQFVFKWYSHEPDAEEKCLALLHEMFDYASTRPDIGTTVISHVSKLLLTSVPSSYEYCQICSELNS